MVRFYIFNFPSNSFIIFNNKISNWHTKIESVLTDEESNYINYDATGDFIN